MYTLSHMDIYMHMQIYICCTPIYICIYITIYTTETYTHHIGIHTLTL